MRQREQVTVAVPCAIPALTHLATSSACVNEGFALQIFRAAATGLATTLDFQCFRASAGRGWFLLIGISFSVNWS